MSKKLTGKEKQSARRMKVKQVASRNRQKTKYLKSKYKQELADIDKVFVINQGKTKESDVVVLRFEARRKDSESGYFCAMSTLTSFKNSDKFQVKYSDKIDMACETLMMHCEKGQFDNLSALMFIGLAKTKKGCYDLPLKIQGISADCLVEDVDVVIFDGLTEKTDKDYHFEMISEEVA